MAYVGGSDTGFEVVEGIGSTDTPAATAWGGPFGIDPPADGAHLHGMTTPEAETRRALARLRRALEKARREVRGLGEGLDESEAEGFPGDDYAEMEEHLAAVMDLVGREQARQQGKILRAGGIASGRLRRSAGRLARGRGGGEGGRRP